jgi:DNA-binding transcriptional ArsR family regulator
MITTWDELELPVLRALADLEDQGASEIDGAVLATATSLPPPRVELALRRLLKANFVAATQYREGTGGPSQFLGIQLIERGLRAAGAWPNA